MELTVKFVELCPVRTNSARSFGASEEKAAADRVAGPGGLRGDAPRELVELRDAGRVGFPAGHLRVTSVGIGVAKLAN